MKKLFLITVLVICTFFANAQIKVITGGNVGIGTPTPGGKLDVNGGALLLSNSYLEMNRDGYARCGISWYRQNYPSWCTYMSPAGWTSQGPHGDLSAPSGTFVTSWALRNYIENNANYGWTFESAGNTTTPAVKFEIRSSDGLFHSYGGGIIDGYVGIGTTSPGYKLTLSGTDNVFAIDNTAIFIAKNASSSYEQYLWPRWSDNIMYLNYGSNGFNIRNNSSTSTIFMTNDGKVGIGTTSPNNLLEVAGLIKFDNTLYNTFLGSTNGGTTTSGTNNTFLGCQSGNSNTTGANNTFSGYQSGYSNTAGTCNTFSGYQSGKVNTASYNTFSGTYSGVANTTGSYNVFCGYAAGLTNTTGVQNAYFGAIAGAYSTGSYNTFIGCSAGYTNSSGYGNTFTGRNVGYYNTTGNNNTFVGNNAGYLNTTASNNTAIGDLAGQYTTTGGNNTFLGYNTGGSSNATGTNCTFVGYRAEASGNYSNATAIGNGAIVTASNYIRIGNASVTQIGGQVGWSTLSDGRFKTNVTENVKGLEFINKLRPVTYQVNTQSYDAFVNQNMFQATDSSDNIVSNIPVDYSASLAIVHSGFIAQEVDSAAQSCGFTSSIVHKPANSTDPYSLSYAEIVVPLVKAVQELNATITEKGQEIQALKTQIDNQEEKIRIQDEKINALETEIFKCCNIAPGSTQKSTINPGGNDNNNSTEKLNGKTSPMLYQNIPNPFKEKTTIKYYLPNESSFASMLIFDMQGKLIKTYNINTTGDGNIEINAGELQPGMYMYSLIANGKEVDTKKMILTE